MPKWLSLHLAGEGAVAEAPQGKGTLLPGLSLSTLRGLLGPVLVNFLTLSPLCSPFSHTLPAPPTSSCLLHHPACPSGSLLLLQCLWEGARLPGGTPVACNSVCCWSRFHNATKQLVLVETCVMPALQPNKKVVSIIKLIYSLIGLDCLLNNGNNIPHSKQPFWMENLISPTHIWAFLAAVKWCTSISKSSGATLSFKVKIRCGVNGVQ